MILFEKLRYLNPDERSSGSLIKKALAKNAIENEVQSTPGVWIRRIKLGILLDELKSKGIPMIYLREDGEDIRDVFTSLADAVFIMGDHMGITENEEEMILNVGARIISVGPLSLHSDHCIVLVNNELDRTTTE